MKTPLKFSLKFFLTEPQYNVISDFCLDIAKAVFLSAVAGYFVPVFGVQVRPKVFILGLLTSLTFLVISIIVVKKENKKQ